MDENKVKCENASRNFFDLQIPKKFKENNFMVSFEYLIGSSFIHTGCLKKRIELIVCFPMDHPVYNFWFLRY